MQKVHELSGRALDTWVARAEGLPTRHWRRVIFFPEYCTDWRAGGPIIDRERIRLLPDVSATDAGWHASMPGSDIVTYGRTPLEAAMRCYVAQKFGQFSNDNDANPVLPGLPAPDGGKRVSF